MMRGEHYAPTPTPISASSVTDKLGKKSKSKVTPAAQKVSVADILPNENQVSAAPVDAFGFGLAVIAKEPSNIPISPTDSGCVQLFVSKYY